MTERRNTVKTKIAKTVKNVLLSMLYITAGVFLIAERKKAVSAALDGLRLCAGAVVPSVLPFAVLAKYFLLSGDAYAVTQQIGGKISKHLNISRISVPVALLGYISGYPTCAELAVKLFKENRISKKEAQRLISFTNNPTPSFIIGFIGGAILENVRYGVVMYICVAVSSLLYAAFSGENSEKHIEVFYENKTAGRIPSFNSAVVSSVGAVSVVCGFTVVSSVVSAGLEELIRSKCVRGAIMLFVDVTVGMVNAKADLPLSPLAFAFLSSVVSFSGLSALVQVSACLEDTKLGIKSYIKGKTIQSAVTFALSFLAFSIFFD